MSARSNNEPQLSIRRMSIGSPMEITFAIDGGVGLSGPYATYLFARILRDPKRVGAWLPEVVASWHEAMRKADDKKAARQLAAQLADVRAAVNLSKELVKLRLEAEEVRTIGVGDLPDDLTHLDAP